MEKQIIIADRYRVIKKIGEGGMAKVYLAFDTKLDLNVALKVLKKENVNEKKVRNFKREALALSMMDDDNIVKVYDVGEEGNIHFIATEYVEGMTLKEYIMTCSPLPVEEVVDLSLQVLKGVAHAHEKNVIHKDIKSQNILLDKDKKIKITDFGIANIMDEDITKTQSLMGTPQYVAPEILNRDVLTEQSDIYSVGILMFEMLVGKAPFTGEKPAVIMMKQMNHPLPSIISERADVPQSLENIVIKASAKRLENRYATALDAINDLNNVFEQARTFEERLVLENDVLNDDKFDKTIILDKEMDMSQLRHESEKIQKNSKRKKFLLFSSIIVIVVAVILILFNGKPPVVMSNLVGLNIKDAQEELSLAGVDPKLINIQYEYNQDVEKDVVLETDPPADEAITSDQVIILKVSQGKEEEAMQDYVNMLQSDVVTQLQDKGYTVNVNEVDNSAVKGTIIDQDPKAGTSITSDNVITFTVSTGNYSISMENFTNLTVEYVEEWAKPYNITVTKEYGCNDTFPKDKIYSQSPGVGEKIQNGGTITVNVSDGACAKVTNEETVV